MKLVNTILGFCIYILALQGCTHAFHHGGLHVVIESRREAHELAIWEWTLDQYAVQQRLLIKPVSHSGTAKFVWLAWEGRVKVNMPRRDISQANENQDAVVDAFYVIADNEVYYKAGDWSSLAHEYCHAANQQLGLNLSYEQDEKYCQVMERTYTLERTNRRLRANAIFDRSDEIRRRRGY